MENYYVVEKALLKGRLLDPVRTDKPYQTSRPTRSASEAGGTIGGPHRRRAGSILLFASALSAGERRVSRPNPPRD
jgi:hypothetical protein